MKKIKLQSQSRIPTKHGEFDVLAFAQNDEDLMPQLALVSPDIDPHNTVLLRIHSECMTGDIFHSQKCDCGEQLEFSLKEVNENNGLVIYLRQEGRGIGLIEKLKAYALQEEGRDTVDANLELGHQADSRNYEDAISILQHLNITKVNLLTNNPDKLTFLVENGIDVVERIPVIIPTQKYSKDYIQTKKDRMGHIL